MFAKKRFFFVGFVLLSFLSFGQRKLPEVFVDVRQEIPSVQIDVRYFGAFNFIGSPIDGYAKQIVYLTQPTVEKLKVVQNILQTKGLGMKIFDGYRPQRAVDFFMKWAINEKDTLMKAAFYPEVAKKDLFKLDYIASKSGHSRGSTLDLTLISLETGKELDMGSPYDFFGKISWPFAEEITDAQKANRMLLRKVMLDNGFKPYKCEWWHFTLKNEPYPDTYFDFVIE